MFDQSLQGGTSLTLRLAKQHMKPVLTIDFADPIEDEAIFSWLTEHNVEVLNVAGPRESTTAGICDATREFLVRLFRDAEE